MMVFMLIAITFMLQVEQTTQTTKLVVKEFEESKNDLAQALKKEFANNLKQWNAEILGDMTFRFDDPNVLFDRGSAYVKPAFKIVLNDFIPRYISLVTSKKYSHSIKEIRIEGHTSKNWAGDTNEKGAFIKNMRLSQQRAQSVLEYILNLSTISPHEKWMRHYLTSSGFSSSKPIYALNHRIDPESSQRVEFVIVTTSEAKMAAIAKEIKSIQK